MSEKHTSTNPKGINFIQNVVMFGCVFALTAIGGCSSSGKNFTNSHSQVWIPPAKLQNIQSEANKTLIIPSYADELLKSSNVPLDLPMLLDIAFENSPIVKKSWQAAKIAAAQNGKSSSIFFPKITISGIVARTESNTPGSKSLATTFYPAIEMQCSIFKFGGDSQTVSAAKDLMYAANYAHNRELQTLAYNVQKCYFLFDSAEQAVEASKKNLEDAHIAYDVAFVKHQAGLANIQDYLQANANKSKAEFELESAKSKVESARANLAIAIGVRVSDYLKISRNTNDPDFRELEINIHDLINESLGERQDILSQQSILKSQRKSLSASYSKLGPELVIGGSGDKKKYDHVSGSYNNFNIYASVRWTVFDGFYNIYNVIEEKAKLKKSEHELENMKLQIAADVWSKYHAFKSVVKQLNAARRFEQSAQESFDSVVTSYKNGLSSISDLMSAQTQLANARQQSVSMKNCLAVAVVELVYSVGIVNFDEKI